MTAEECPKQLIEGARDLVNRAVQMLESPTPENLAECQPLLRSAIKNMEDLLAAARTTGVAAPPATRTEVVAFHRQVRSLQRLLDSSAAFHAGWRTLCAAFSGYTGSGQAGLIQPGPRVVVRG